MEKERRGTVSKQKADAENNEMKDLRMRLHQDLHGDLKKICKKLGVTISDFLRPVIIQARDNNSKYLRKNSID